MSSPLTLGTAGHIDHGKTALIRALTGVDTDRLPEERARGISIELGYASLELPSGRRLSVVDVPGHERFVRTMVAGATGIDLFLMTIASDDGVMPQTREHAAVLEALGVGTGVVAVTKSDLADPEVALIEASELFPASEAVAVSVTDRRRHRGSARRARPRHRCGRLAGRRHRRPARLHVDRVFTIRGAGTVVTGTLWSGEVGRGDELEILPGRAAGPRARRSGTRSAARPGAGGSARGREPRRHFGRRDRARGRTGLGRRRRAALLPGGCRARLQRPRTRARRSRSDPPRHARGGGSAGLARGALLAGPPRAADRPRGRRPDRGAPGGAAGYARRRPGARPTAAPARPEPRRARPPRTAGSRRRVAGTVRTASRPRRTARSASGLANDGPATSSTDAELAKSGPARTRSNRRFRGRISERGPKNPSRAPPSSLEQRLREAGVEPPIDSELDAGDLAALRDAGRAVRVSKALHYHADSLDEIRARLVELAHRNDGAVTLAAAARRARHLAQVRPGAARALRFREGDDPQGRRARAAPQRRLTHNAPPAAVGAVGSDPSDCACSRAR